MKKLLLCLAFASSTHAGPVPQADARFAVHDPAEIALGQLLFYDPVLSGNREVACATCHHPRFGTSDGLSLGLGDGGTGLGPDRRANPANQPPRRVARNAPALFNLGAAGFTSLFHDGRLEADADQPTGIRTPMGAEMVEGFDSPLAAQAMFPVLAGDEMAGHYGENDVSRAVSQGLITTPGGAWEIIAARVAALPDYRRRFTAVIGNAPIRFTDIANAIAAFTAFEWRADNSPFDQYLQGEAALPASALRGLALDIHLAKVDTIGREVVDAFYVLRENGRRVEEPDEIERLRHRVIEAVSALDGDALDGDALDGDAADGEHREER